MFVVSLLFVVEYGLLEMLELMCGVMGVGVDGVVGEWMCWCLIVFEGGVVDIDYIFVLVMDDLYLMG